MEAVSCVPTSNQKTGRDGTAYGLSRRRTALCPWPNELELSEKAGVFQVSQPSRPKRTAQQGSGNMLFIRGLT